MDEQLLLHLEKNSRLSLKKLAQKINVKTSTLYHRFHKLSESKIIEQNSVVVNPESIGVDSFYLLILGSKISSKNKPDKMFLISFATFLTEQFKEIYFGAVGGDLRLYILVSFFSKSHREEFFKVLKSNPYIENIKRIKLNSISKGMRMFSFNDEVLLEELNMKEEEKSLKDLKEELKTPDNSSGSKKGPKKRKNKRDLGKLVDLND
ncbi:MAG: Lrp/AsnC family transcriptional regulator [Promethearchaeota archaeon]